MKEKYYKHLLFNVDLQKLVTDHSLPETIHLLKLCMSKISAPIFLKNIIDETILRIQIILSTLQDYVDHFRKPIYFFETGNKTDAAKNQI